MKLFPKFLGNYVQCSSLNPSLLVLRSFPFKSVILYFCVIKNKEGIFMTAKFKFKQKQVSVFFSEKALYHAHLFAFGKELLRNISLNIFHLNTFAVCRKCLSVSIEFAKRTKYRVNK